MLSTMPKHTGRMHSGGIVSYKTVVIFVLSMFVFRAAESRWCFEPDQVDQACVDKVKTETGLNSTTLGGFSGNRTTRDFLVLVGCSRMMVPSPETGCYDADYLVYFYSCVYNYTVDMKEELKRVNLTSLETRQGDWKSVQGVPQRKGDSVDGRHMGQGGEGEQRHRLAYHRFAVLLIRRQDTDAPRRGRCSTVESEIKLLPLITDITFFIG
ncbi:uncharacterized protein LOC125946827 [Dermacentor silvarum]|uniref:uncharacterized protein LOC125946827 n=1 Tax=Dermacentor silvarum TaxID=543639 RepID=UPI002100F904|nr:uncharacterized protein LOC125946827 [Dermacentor silvarum]